jgi:hypothetical protein
VLELVGERHSVLSSGSRLGPNGWVERTATVGGWFLRMS